MTENNVIISAEEEAKLLKPIMLVRYRNRLMHFV